MQYQWIDEEAKIISCTEKNKILNENIKEILDTIQNAKEDAILMGVSEENFTENLRKSLADIVI